MASWEAFLSGFSAAIVLPVLAGVLTALAIKVTDVWLGKRAKRKEYGDLHKSVYHLADESAEAARQIVNSLSTNPQPERWVRPELLVYAPWEAVRTTYMDLSPRAREVYDLSVFFGQVQAFSELVRRYVQPPPTAEEMKQIADTLHQAYKDLETAHANLKKTYWHPDYKPAYFPSNPNPPKPK